MVIINDGPYKVAISKYILIGALKVVGGRLFWKLSPSTFASKLPLFETRIVHVFFLGSPLSSYFSAEWMSEQS
jgi:hypothetical protein